MNSTANKMSLCACVQNNLYSSETGNGLTIWMFYEHQKVNIALCIAIEIAEEINGKGVNRKKK